MSNQRRSPIIHKQVHALDLLELDGAGEPLTAVVELSAIVAIPKVMDGHLAAMDISPGRPGLVRPPLFIIRGPKRHPPGQDCEEAKQPNEELPLKENKKYPQPINNRCKDTQPWKRQVDG